MHMTRLKRPGIVRRMWGLTNELAREQRALSRASRRMPKPVPWDWAAPRLLPLLSGPVFDPSDLRTIRARSELGPTIEFGLDLGKVFAVVDEDVARRWEVSSDQLLTRSLANLRERATRIGPDSIIHGVLAGYPVRFLRDRPIWASSVILDDIGVTRLFGTHDQVLATPTRRSLISLPIDTPPRVVAEIVVDLELGSFRALLLDPFVVEDGKVVWGDSDADDEFDGWTS